MECNMSQRLFKAASCLHVNPPRDPLNLATNLNSNIIIRDPFDMLNKYSEIRMMPGAEEIPTPFGDSFNCVTIAELIDARAHEIVSKYQRIAVLYSGGVDSTTVMVSLLKALPSNETDRLIVVYDETSIQENPVFWRDYITKTKCEFVEIHDHITLTIRELDCDVIVSGWCADQLFGSDLHVNNHDLFNVPWLDGLKETYLRNKGILLSDRTLSTVNCLYADYAKTFDIKLDQFCEFAWMINWSFKFSYLRDELNLRLAYSKNANKGLAFFGTMDFRRWSLTRYPKIKDHCGYKDSLYYKVPLKTYIIEYNQDAKYYKQKNKVGSIRRVNNYLPEIIVDTDQGYIRFLPASSEISSDLTNYQVWRALNAKALQYFRKE